MPRFLKKAKHFISRIVIISIIASFFVAVPIARADVTSGLVGHWTMDESDISGTTVYDKSGQGNNGTMTGTANAAGQINQARSFNGTSDFIDVGHGSSLDITQAISICGWFYMRGGAAGDWISKRPGGTVYGLYGSTSLTMVLSVNGAWDTNMGTITIGGNTWAHACFTYDSATRTGIRYKNGAHDGTDVVLSGKASYTIDSYSNTSVGMGTNNYYMNGALDDVRIYDRALSSAEVTQLYNYTGTVHNLSNISDTLSDSDLSVTATHTVGLTSNSSLAAGESMSITWPTGFTGISNLTSSDLSASGMTIVSSCTASPNEMTSSAAGQILTLTVCAGDTVSSGAKIITVGGTNKITNPSSAGSKEIRIDWDSDESGKTRVAIIDDVNITASMATAFSFTIAAKTSGTVNGEGTSCEAGTTTTAIPFGTLTASAPKVACQTLSVTTNAKNGFVVTVKEDQRLTSANGADIDTFKDDSQLATPADWEAPSDTLDSETTYGYMGVTSEDADLNSDEFGSAKYAGNFLSARTLFSHTGPSNGTTANKGQTNVAYKIEIGSLQEAADDYSATLTYVATPTF
ncbi:MAG: LamG domain-containing protein [bacterium]